MPMINQTLLAELIEELSETLLELNTHQVTRLAHFPTMKKKVNVATGMRRVGKTYLLWQQVQKLLSEGVAFRQILYVNFEDDRLLPMRQEQLAQLLDLFYATYPDNYNRTCYLFLDEIQNVDGWPLVIRRFMDSKKVRIYLSGSSAKLLSKEIASTVRGRSLTTEVWPYSWTEYKLAHSLVQPQKPFSQKTTDIHCAKLKEYLLMGGFPEVQGSEPLSNKRQTLQSYVDIVIYRDIIERHNITNISLLNYLVKCMLKNIACKYSPHKFFNDIKSQGFKASKNTVYDYMHHIEDAYLAFAVPLYSESLRQVQSNPKKIYAVDSGLAHAYNMSFSENIGRLFENMFYLELRRLGHEVYYYNTKDGFEIDFFTRDLEGKLHLYQVVWDRYDLETLQCEKRALKAAENELGIQGTLVDPSYFVWNF